MGIESLNSGFDPYGDIAKEEFGTSGDDLEQQGLDNSDIDWGIKYAELTAHHIV